MMGISRPYVCVILALVSIFVIVGEGEAQETTGVTTHQIEGRLRIRNAAGSNLRVRLLREDQRRPIAETFSRSRGEFEFTRLPEGNYIVETFETPELEATSTAVAVRPLQRERPIVVHIEIEIPIKAAPSTVEPAVITADVDVRVPKEALKHYRAGMKALSSGKAERAIEEFQSAITIYPEYYAARLELGRELRLQKRFREAADVLMPLGEVAPKRAEPRIEYGITLLGLGRTSEAADALGTAVRLDETNWAPHFYLGWALIETAPLDAERHFRRALELSEQKAVRAYLALARLANEQGMRQLAVKYLENYLALAPDGPDAETARKLVKELRQ